MISVDIKTVIGSLLILTMFVACNNGGNLPPGMLKRGALNTSSFGFDRTFLQQNDSKLVQLTIGEASVLVSPRFQGKVFTSTNAGDTGRSFGWINYRAFSRPVDPHMNAYGGENRFWLGPEGGRFSLFFEPGDTMTFQNWKTPAAFDTEPWQLLKKSDRSVTMRKEMRLTNYLNELLSIRAERVVSMQDRKEAEATLGITLNDSIAYVGYSTLNSIRNVGEETWSDSTGMPCIWILDMFNPSPATTVVLPFIRPAEDEKYLNTDYFEAPGKTRLKIRDSVVFFKADGNKRSKIGVQPNFARPMAGSYDAKNHLLTIIWFDVERQAPYLSQQWKNSTNVFGGDVVNAYNDGPVNGAEQMGPFYELESVSPAAALSPGDAITHRHDVYHFTGAPKYLDSIAVKTLGVNIKSISAAFRN